MSRATNYRSRPPSRPPSEQLVDLHVYVVPPDVWRDRFNNFLNQAVIETVSLGIIRVPPEVRLVDLRQELMQQLEDLVPQEYVFLRSVGRSITRLKSKQEYQYKVKHFVRPQAYADELYLLEASPDLQSFTSRSQSPQSSRHAAGSHGGSPRLHRPHGYRPPETYQGYDDRYTQTNDLDYLEAGPAHTNRSQREPPFQHYSPLPKIPLPQNGRDPHHPHHPHSHPHHGYPDSSFPSDPFARSKQAPDPSDPYYSQQRRQHPPDPSSNPSPGYPEAEQPGYDPRGHDPYEARGPRDAHRAPSRENTLTPDSQGEGEGEGEGTGSGGREDRVGQAQSDAGRGSRAGPESERAHGTSPPPPPLTERREGGGGGGGKGARGDDPRAATYTTNTNEDSGVAGLSPDDNFDELLDRRKKFQSQLDRDKADHEREEELERQRRLRDLDERDIMDREKWDQDSDERRRRYEEERKRRLQEEEDRKRQAEGDDKRNRRADSDDDNDNRGKRGHDNKHRRGSSEEEEEQEASGQEANEEEREAESEEVDPRRARFSLEELNRFPSPPPVTRTPPAARDTESARQTRKREKDKLLQELEAAKEERKHAEKEREELVKKAKQLQNKTQNRRNHARDVWKKRYFEEKKKTAPLEDQTSKLRAELDHLHKKLMASLEGPKQQRGLGIHTSRPSQRNNYVIQCTRLQHEIEDLHRRVENAKMKLTAEMKLRNQAEAELRALRAELTQKKINLTLTRNQHWAIFNPPLDPPAPTPLPLVPSSMA